MNYAVERDQGVVLLTVTGDLWGDENTFALKAEVARWIRDGETRFLIDLGGGLLNSTGIGVLVAILVGVRRVDGVLKISNVGGRASRALRVAGVWELFDIHADTEEAWRSWGAPAAA